MSASDVPGYIQGYRFSDAPEFYNSATQTFPDLAGYGARAGLVINNGTPAFATVGGARCLRLDNTFNGIAPSPIPFLGSFLIVVKPEYTSGGTLTRDLVTFGDAVSAASNGNLYVQHASAARRVGVRTPSGSTVSFLSRNDDNLVVVGGAVDPEPRRAYTTSDGVTLNDVLATASTVNSLAITLRAGVGGMRVGDLNNAPADLTELSTFFAHLFEVHFFAENIWLAHPTEAQAYMAEVRAAYGQ